MCEGAEGSSGAVSVLLDVVALGGLVDLRMELLLRARMAVLTRVALLTLARLTPFIPVLHIGTSSRPVESNKLYSSYRFNVSNY